MNRLTFSQKIAIVLLYWAVVAWVTGAGGRLLVVVPLLLFAPGYIIERLFPVPLPPVPFVRVAIWLGISISSITLLYSWATVAHLVLTHTVLMLLAVLCGSAVLWLLWHMPPEQPSTGMETTETRRHGETAQEFPDSTIGVQEHSKTAGIPSYDAPVCADTPARNSVSPCLCGSLQAMPITRNTPQQQRTLGIAWALLLAVFALTLWNRFSQIRDLVMPAWVDPVHHSLIIQVVLDTGQAPYSLRPYLPVDHLPYHWGYHVLTATTIQLAGMPLPQVMLWQGQLLNALHVLTCAALATYFWRNSHAGIVAGIVVGVISIMPAYYVSWGRYTHLTGMLILPPLAISWHALLHTRSRAWLLASTLMLAGLCLVHTLVLVLTLCLLAAITLCWLLDNLDRPWQTMRLHLQTVFLAAACSLFLSLPWLWVILQRILLPAIDREQSQTLENGSDYAKLSEGLLWAGENRLLIALVLVGLFWAFWQRIHGARVVFAWLFLVAMLANPWTIRYLLPIVGLFTLLWAWYPPRIVGIMAGIIMLLLNPWTLPPIPYIWIMTNDIMTFSLFVPISLLVGGLSMLWLRWLSHHIATQRGWRIVMYTVYALALVAWAGWGTWNLRHVINNETVLVTTADTLALEWIHEHPDLVPPGSRFLINAAGWYPNAERGTDGGYWLMSLMGFWTSTPPAMFVHGPPDYVQHMQAISHQVSTFQAGQEDRLHQLIEQEQISHIYFREGRGTLTASLFANNPRYTTIYAYDGVVILATNQ